MVFYEKIDWDKVGGKDKFLDSAVNDCGVGAIVWSTAIAYNGDKLKRWAEILGGFLGCEEVSGQAIAAQECEIHAGIRAYG